MRIVQPESRPPDSPVMDHDALRRGWAGRLYNHRWHSSREDMWALLIGRHERCGGDSLLRFLPSDGIAWKRIAGFACSPVSHVELASYPDPVTLAPDPRRGVVARPAAAPSASRGSEFSRSRGVIGTRTNNCALQRR